MTREEIMNTYSIEQGYENWESLLDVNAFCWNIVVNHQNTVTDLIQDKLKNKIANEQDLEGMQHLILNTENL